MRAWASNLFVTKPSERRPRLQSLRKSIILILSIDIEHYIVGNRKLRWPPKANYKSSLSELEFTEYKAEFPISISSKLIKIPKVTVMVLGWGPGVLIMETAEDKQFVDRLCSRIRTPLGRFTFDWIREVFTCGRASYLE